MPKSACPLDDEAGRGPLADRAQPRAQLGLLLPERPPRGSHRHLPSRHGGHYRFRSEKYVYLRTTTEIFGLRKISGGIALQDLQDFSSLT